MKCKNCKNKLKNNEPFCGKCGSEVVKSKSNKSKKIIVFVTMAIALVILTIVFVVGLGKTKIVEQRINEDIEVLSSCDIKKINNVLFSENIVEEEFKKFIETPEPTATDGIMADIISLAEIELTAKTQTSVTFSVLSPDMSDFSDEILPLVDANTTEEELKELITDYAKNSEKVLSEVTLDYTVENGTVYINYNTPDFLNAITGNFATGYAEIYKEYILSLTEEVPEE